MNKIIYVSRAGLPMDAPGIRIFNIGSILENLNYQIHYISALRITDKEKNSGYQLIDNTHNFPSEDIHFKIDKKVYSYLPKNSGGRKTAMKELLEIITAKELFKRVAKYCDIEKPEAIILYNDTYSLTKKLIPYCKKKNIKLFADVTEWYEKDKNKAIGEKLIASLAEKRIKKLDHKLDGIIAISDYLEEYYKEKDANCINIPPLMDIDLTLEVKKHEYYDGESVVNIVYAGSPGGKDIILPFVQAIQEINKEKIKIRLDVVGIDEKYFNSFSEINQNLKETGIYAHGRLPHNETVEIVKNADFGILLRHNKRYAKAGFSTKFAECMSLGVPMICNKVGGCDLSIEHMENGILINSAEYDEIYKILKFILSLSNEQIVTIKRNAYNYATQRFQTQNYQEAIQKFIDI